jgi:hypothetical protein
MTKSQKYRMSRVFKRRSYNPRLKERTNYVHQIVRFDAYLTINSTYDKDLLE